MGQFLLRGSVFAILALFAGGGALRGGVALLVSKEPKERVSIKFQDREIDARLVPVQSLGTLTVALFTSTLSADDLLAIRPGLQKLFSAVPNVRIAMLNNDSVQSAGPFKTRREFQAALGEIDISQIAGTAPTPSQFYSTLPERLSEFGAGWNSVLIIARLPKLDEHLCVFSTAYLISKMTTQRTRLNILNFGDGADFLTPVTAATGGVMVDGTLDNFIGSVKNADTILTEVAWTDPIPSRGFELYNSQVDSLVLPSVEVAANAKIPDIEEYRLYLGERERVAGSWDKLDRDNEFRSSLKIVLEVNPGDQDAWRYASQFYTRTLDHSNAVLFLTLRAEKQKDLLVDLGNEQFLAGDMQGAEKSLLEWRQQHPTTVLVSEHLFKISVSKNDNPGALNYVNEILALDPKRQDLWFARADLAERLNNVTLQADSLEHGLPLGGTFLDRRTSLIRLYLAQNSLPQAATHVDLALGQLSDDPQILGLYAGFLERLDRPEDSLRLWKNTVRLSPRDEAAHFSVTRLLIGKNSLPEALASAEAGLEVAPNSARLHLAKSTILEREGKIYQTRHALAVASSIDDLALFRFNARIQDAHGDSAPTAYQRLAEAERATEDVGLPATLQRGLEVSNRDGDDSRANWFTTRLQKPRVATNVAKPRKPGVWIPGGFAALAFIAHGKDNSSPDEFLGDYARAITANSGNLAKPILTYVNPLRDYFQKLASLLELAKRTNEKAVISLVVTDKKSRQTTERVLGLLGWRLIQEKNQWHVQSGTKASQARRQDVAAALNIDQILMEEAFNGGKPFELIVPFDWATIALNEDAWKSQYYANEKLPCGFAELLAKQPQIAAAYAGLSSVSTETASALVGAMGLKNIVDRHASVLEAFSSVLVVANSRVETPGGPRAADLWNSLVGVPSTDPPRFLKTIFEKQDGQLLAYFFAIGQLDSQRQLFFTRNQRRLSRFYDLFREAPESKQRENGHVITDSFSEFLRQVPLDSNGSVEFPGGAEVWMVAKGASTSEAHTAQLLKKARKAAAPDVEDEILLRLARMRYEHDQQSELQNFLGVSQIDQHRGDSLDDVSAIGLAQNYAHYGSIYPYFTILTALTAREFNQFFRFGKRVEQMSPDERNAVLGEFFSVLEILRLAVQSRAIDDRKAAEVFFTLNDRFLQASTDGAYVQACLELIAKIANGADLGIAIRNVLIPDSPPIEIPGHDPVDYTIARRKDFDRVLQMQSAPPLQAILDLAAAARAIAKDPTSASAQLKALDEAAKKIPSVDLAKSAKAGKAGKVLAAEQPEKALAIVARIRQKAASRKLNPKDFEKLEQELLSGLAPAMRLALAGIVYAYYFRSTDLLVSDDPLLIRKHRFYDFGATTKTHVFMSSSLVTGDDLAQGAFFTGSFARFSIEVGRALITGSRFRAGAESFAASQLAGIRGVSWSGYNEVQQRLMGLKLRLAREWCVRASFDLEAQRELAEATSGMISLNRRRDLLEAIAAGNWDSVRSSLTLGDLYSLAEKYIARHDKPAWDSPVTHAIQEAIGKEDNEALNALGTIAPSLDGCDRPHLVSLPPYEEFERHVTTGPILERSSEFKLYLADFMNRRAIPAEAMRLLAEPVAREILSRITPSDAHDWRTVFKEFLKIDDDILSGALAAR